jgi:8-oxo-dGTP diphosphatase
LKTLSLPRIACKRRGVDLDFATARPYIRSFDIRFELATHTRHQMARTSVLAAGGIVLRRQQPPLIAVVRLRKRDEWVLPKGKLDDGETPRAAALREVLEETGHDVSVHEFLGTLVYESGGRSKVVHYWRMETSGGQVYELMDDVRAVEWLPLQAAVERLSRGYERAFLENVGPIALQAAARARTPRPKAKPAAEKRARRPAAAPRPSLAIAAPPVIAASPAITAPAPLQPDPVPAATAQDVSASAARDVVDVDISACAVESEPVQCAAATPAVEAELMAPAMEPQSAAHDTAITSSGRRPNLVQRMRAWLQGAGPESA